MHTKDKAICTLCQTRTIDGEAGVASLKTVSAKCGCICTRVLTKVYRVIRTCLHLQALHGDIYTSMESCAAVAQIEFRNGAWHGYCYACPTAQATYEWTRNEFSLLSTTRLYLSKTCAWLKMLF